jgi:lysophospholipase L1-like esterase
MKPISRASFLSLVTAAMVGLVLPATAQPLQILAPDATRYLALGDSIASGYQAVPVTNAYPFVLYRTGVFDAIPHTLFANAAVPGAASGDFLQHQVPQAIIPAAAGGFRPGFITVTIGGNDLLSILHFMQTHPNQSDVLQFAGGVLAQYGQNLYMGLVQLRSALPNAKIYVANQYTVPSIEALVPLAQPLIGLFNAAVRDVVAAFDTNVYLVDVYSALLGGQRLLLSDRPGVSPFETHLTRAGHREMAQAFAAVIAQTR